MNRFSNRRIGRRIGLERNTANRDFANFKNGKSKISSKALAIALSLSLVLTMGGASVFADETVTSENNSDQNIRISTQQPLIATNKKFSDLDGHWAKSIIEEAASLGIVGGYPEGDYKPDNLMKREEFFKIVINILTEKPEITTDTKNKMAAFGDVLPQEWYVSTIESAVAAGITNGNTYYSFGIGMMITRQEAAKVISTILDPDTAFTNEELAKGDEKFAQTKDKAKIDDWAYDHVKKVFQRGYIQGDSEGNFNPTNALTRAEAATLLLNVVKKEKTILGPAQPRTATPKDDEKDTELPKDDAIPIGGIDDDEVKYISKSVNGSNIGCKKNHKEEDGAFTNGTGTIADPYVVETSAQLNHIREHATDGAYFIFKNDIEFDKKTDFAVPDGKVEDSEIWAEGNFAPIGTKKAPFNGHIDGNGYGIYGLKIEASAQNVGLVSFLSENGSIINLSLEESTISAGQYVGGFVGTNDGTITGCTLGKKSKVIGTNYVGGIAGYSNATMTQNRNKGLVEGKVQVTGGIVGAAQVDTGYVSGCVNDGTVRGMQKVGGIVGQAIGRGKGLMVESCSNKGEVSSSNYGAGGIIGETDGRLAEVTVQRCFNKATVTGSALNGGVVGKVDAESTVQNCFNLGKVFGSGAGGIVGTNLGIVQDSANKGKVHGKVYAGGILGGQEENGALVQRCYNDGEVTSDSSAGGIVGENAQKIKNCYNTAKIKAKTYAGGIVASNKGTVSVCYNIGDIEANLAGEITGFNSGTQSYLFWIDGGVGECAGQYESNFTKRPQVAKTVSYGEMTGKDKIEASRDDKDYILELLNKYAGTDVWEFVKGYKYPSLIDSQRD